MKILHQPIVLTMSFLLVACGGGSSRSDDSNTSPVEAETPELAVGGATSEIQCQPAFSFNDHKLERADRIDNLCKLVNKLYSLEDMSPDEIPTVTLNVDFMDTGSDYLENIGNYKGTEVHSGIDTQGSGTLRGAKIKSLSNGIVESIHQSHGNVVIRSNIDGVGSRAISYMHLSNIPSDLNIGDIVSVGTVLGKENNIGVPNSGDHLHIELLSYQYSKSLTSYLPDNLFTWGDDTSEGVVLDLLDITDQLLKKDGTSAPNPLITAYVPQQWVADQDPVITGLVEPRDGLQFKVINSFSNVVYTSEVYQPQPNDKGLSSLDGYFGSNDEVLNLPSGDYVLRIIVLDDDKESYSDYQFYLTQSDQTIQPEPAQPTILDVSLERDTYLYYGEYITLEGCVTSATSVIAMKVEMETPQNGEYQQSYISGSEDVFEETDDCNGYPGYEVDLDIDSYTDGFNYSVQSLGEYELTVTILFEDDTSTVLDTMTVDVISQVEGLELLPTLERDHVSVLGTYVDKRDDNHRIPKLVNFRVKIEGYGEVGASPSIYASDVQISDATGSSTGFSFITEFAENGPSIPIGAGQPLVLGETYDYKVITEDRGGFEVVLDEGEVTLEL